VKIYTHEEDNMLSLTGDTQKRLGIVYLFLSAERRINDADYALFEQTGATLDGFKDARGTIIGECEKALSAETEGKNRYDIVSEIFSEYASSTSPFGGTSFVLPNIGLGGFWFGQIVSDADKRSILWLLLGIMLESGQQTETRQKLVDLWIEKSKIDPSVYNEMKDTTETLAAIANEKAWLEASKGMSYKAVNSMMQELEKNLQEMQGSVSSLIALG
jgi:hypothetical protein